MSPVLIGVGAAPPRPPPPAPAPPPRPPAPPPRGAAGAQFLNPPVEPGAINLIPIGSSFETMYIVPFAGSTAELPQLAPPLLPGIWIVPRILGGVNRPSLRDSRRSSRMQLRSSSGRYGLMSFSVNDCRAN